MSDSAHGPFYASFLLRLAANIVDRVFISFIFGIIAKGILWQYPRALDEHVFLFFLLLLVISVLYFSVFESSKWQATPGKKIYHLKVGDIHGHRISFGRALGRYIVKVFVSTGPLYAGFLFIFFTKKKQAAHDLVIQTIVTRSGKKRWNLLP
ncbi:MAG: RDD family protein [Candidatus Peribacteraceae bacterium]|nr:RDD family protein [Candidatus Peribacteraceae bacterium]